MADAAADYIRLPIYGEQMARALNFTDADLQDNRAGRLSAAQQAAQLGVVARSAFKSGLLLLLAVAGVAISFAVGPTTAFGVILLVLAALLGAWIGVFAWYMPPIWRDATAGAVSSVEGAVALMEQERDIPLRYGGKVPIWTYYWVVDGQQRFWVPANVYPVLTPARHRLYYLPRSRRVVAAEAV